MGHLEVGLGGASKSDGMSKEVQGSIISMTLLKFPPSSRITGAHGSYRHTPSTTNLYCAHQPIQMTSASIPHRKKR